MTPEQLSALRKALPRFTDGPELAGESAELLDQYCRYYAIDFADRAPYPRHRIGTVRSGDFTLATQFWQVDGARANLLLLHGYFDHTGLFGKLVDYGLSRGFNVLVFDLPGHGLSSGEQAVIDDFSDYGQAIAHVLATVELPPLPLWVMAQSTGCAALVNFAGNHPWPFSAAVLLAPLVRPAAWRRVRAAHMVMRHFTDSIKRSFNENSSDREFLAFVQRDPLQCRRLSLRWIAALRRWLANLPVKDLRVGPALVIQGDMDKTVAWRSNLKVICQLFPGSQLRYLNGAGHQLANESTQIRQEYLAVVDAWLSARGVPVGAITGSEENAAADGPLDRGKLGQRDVAVLGVDVDDHIAD